MKPRICMYCMGFTPVRFANEWVKNPNNPCYYELQCKKLKDFYNDSRLSEVQHVK